MPCDSVITQSVNLSKALPSILEETLTSLGWRITRSTPTLIQAAMNGTYLTWKAGEGLRMQGYSNQQSCIEEITKAYSVKAVSWAAQKAGWSVIQTEKDKLTVSRR